MAKLKVINIIKQSPATPGVYLWLDKNNQILYVGRAVNLHNRLKQYLQKDIDSRIKEMVELSSSIRLINCPTLLEAIFLEANLIKKHWPKYNIRDKDNRSFVYVVFAKTAYPKPLIVRGRELAKFPEHKFIVFGPYQSLRLITNALKLIRRVFPYSTCQPLNGKACFDYQIGLCPGACVGKISQGDYQKNIKKIIELLKGNRTKLLKSLLKSEVLALKHLQDVSLLEKEVGLEVKINRIEGYDISHLAGKECYASMVVFENGVANKSEYRLFKIKAAPASDDLRALQEVITRRLKHQEWTKPDIMMIDGGGPQINFLVKNNSGMNFVGISKYGNDALVFPTKSSKVFRQLAAAIKPTLLQVREEAHRFANLASRRARKY